MSSASVCSICCCLSVSFYSCCLNNCFLSVLTALFREIDADGSGQLDEEEFGNLLNCMGTLALLIR